MIAGKLLSANHLASHDLASHDPVLKRALP
jgi:hypothetical protein